KLSQNPRSGLLLSGTEAFGAGEQHQRDEDRQLEADRPHELGWVGKLLDVQEPFQPLDSRDGGDRTEQLQLEAAEVALGNAGGPIRVLLGIDLVDEILVTGEDDDQDQVRHQRKIDQVQDTDDEFLAPRAAQVHEQLVALQQGLADEKDDPCQQDQKERRRQPPRDEDRPLDVTVSTDHDFLPNSIRNVLTAAFAGDGAVLL